MRKYTLKDIVDLMEFTPKNGVKLLQVIDDESDEFDIVVEFCQQVLAVNDIESLSQNDLRDYLMLQERFKNIDTTEYVPEWTDQQVMFFISQGARPVKGTVTKARKLFKQGKFKELEPLLVWIEPGVGVGGMPLPVRNTFKW